MNIVFTNDIKLANDLKNANVSNIEKFFYCTFFIIGSQLLGIIILKIPVALKYTEDSCISYCSTYSSSSLVMISFLSLLIKGYAIFSSYKINLDHKGQDFIERLICLLFPVTIRMSILMFIIKFLTSLASEIGNDIEMIYSINPVLFIDIISPLIVAIYFQSRLTKIFRILTTI